MGTLLALMLFGNRTLRLWTPLLALGAGYLLSWALGLLELHQFSASSWIGLPGMHWPGLVTDLNMSHLPIFAAFFMAALAGSIEGTGNIMLVQNVSRRDKKISYDRIRSGLYCDGLGKFLCGMGGGTPISTYCDNIPLIEMTGVASKIIGVAGAIFLGLLAFIPKAGAIILDMPSPVVGGHAHCHCRHALPRRHRPDHRIRPQQPDRTDDGDRHHRGHDRRSRCLLS